MNHCVLEAEVTEAPQLRYTPDNQTPITELRVSFDPLRPDDPRPSLKVVGWGDNLAQTIQREATPGQRLVLVGRLRINTVQRPDGIRGKEVEFSLSRLHPVATAAQAGGGTSVTPPPAPAAARAAAAPTPSWDAGPLVPEGGAGVEPDEIPF